MCNSFVKRKYFLHLRGKGAEKVSGINCKFAKTTKHIAYERKPIPMFKSQNLSSISPAVNCYQSLSNPSGMISSKPTHDFTGFFIDFLLELHPLQKLVFCRNYSLR